MGLLVMVNAASSRSPAEAPVGLLRISDEVAVELMLSREPTTEMPAADGAVTLIVVVAGALDAPAFDAVSDAVYRASSGATRMGRPCCPAGDGEAVKRVEHREQLTTFGGLEAQVLRSAFARARRAAELKRSCQTSSKPPARSTVWTMWRVRAT